MGDINCSEFFLAYGIGFERNPLSPIEVEFQRLAYKRGWTKKKGLKKYWHECLVSELRFQFQDVLRCETKHEALRTLCDLVIYRDNWEEVNTDSIEGCVKVRQACLHLFGFSRDGKLGVYSKMAFYKPEKRIVHTNRESHVANLEQNAYAVTGPASIWNHQFHRVDRRSTKWRVGSDLLQHSTICKVHMAHEKIRPYSGS